MSTVDQLLTVEKMMPEQSAQALDTFTTINPSYEGAGWADCLDVLADTDARLDITEPIYEALEGRATEAQRPYIGLIALTLLFTADERPPTPDEVWEWVEKVPT